MMRSQELPISTLVFDMDGTLWDEINAFEDCLKAAASATVNALRDWGAQHGVAIDGSVESAIQSFGTIHKEMHATWVDDIFDHNDWVKTRIRSAMPEYNAVVADKQHPGASFSYTDEDRIRDMVTEIMAPVKAQYKQMLHDRCQPFSDVIDALVRAKGLWPKELSGHPDGNALQVYIMSESESLVAIRHLRMLLEAGIAKKIATTSGEEQQFYQQLKPSDLIDGVATAPPAGVKATGSAPYELLEVAQLPNQCTWRIARITQAMRDGRPVSPTEIADANAPRNRRDLETVMPIDFTELKSEAAKLGVPFYVFNQPYIKNTRYGLETVAARFGFDVQHTAQIGDSYARDSIRSAKAGAWAFTLKHAEERAGADRDFQNNVGSRPPYIVRDDRIITSLHDTGATAWPVAALKATQRKSSSAYTADVRAAVKAAIENHFGDHDGNRSFDEKLGGFAPFSSVVLRVESLLEFIEQVRLLNADQRMRNNGGSIVGYRLPGFGDDSSFPGRSKTISEAGKKAQQQLAMRLKPN